MKGRLAQSRHASSSVQPQGVTALPYALEKCLCFSSRQHSLFSFHIGETATGIALESGRNVITVTARDTSGNTSTDSIEIT